MTRPFLASLLLALTATLPVAPVTAGGLQVAPVMLNIKATQIGDGLELSNAGDRPLNAQVRVFRWTQDTSGEQLTPTREVLASPPIIALQPGERQLVRVVRAATPPAAGMPESSYRLSVDELPSADTDVRGLKFVFRYTLPVFLAPVGDAAVQPKLDWRFEQSETGVQLVATNAGTGHAQIADLVVRRKGAPDVTLAKGLLGYVLPGATMRWPAAALQSDPGSDAELGMMLNGQPTSQKLSAPSPSR